MRWLVCACIVGWHETAPITLILRHLGNQLSFASTSSCPGKIWPNQDGYILVFPTWSSNALIAFFLLPLFSLFHRSILSREKLDFLCDTIGWIACCVLYTDPILLFIFLRFIPERLGYIRSIENIFEKQLSPWRGLFVSKLYLQLPWALTWTQREKKKKLDPIHLINLFYLSPVLFLPVHQPMRSLSRKKSMENCQSVRLKSPRRWREMRRIQELKQDKKRFVRQRKSNRETILLDGKNLATTE